MASTSHATLCAVAALLLWTAIGYPVTRRLLAPTLALPFAPIAGWALHGALAVPLLSLLPFDAAAIVAAAALVLIAVFVAVAVDRRTSLGATGAVPDGTEALRIPVVAWVSAVALASIVASAIVPKHVGDAVLLADQIFDHAKVALVDDIARFGVPPGNPFLGGDGGAGRLSYYYLWHFSAAELSRVLGVSGWEAEIAMTFFSAFTSLAAMMALAVRFSGRASAAFWVAAIAASSSSRVVLIWWFGGPTLDTWVSSPGGFGGWFFQSSWVPQHLASTSCVLLALLTMARLSLQRSALAAIATALVVAAGFESSTWIGGVVFALVAIAVVPLLTLRMEASRRAGFVAALAIVAALTLLIAWPFLADQVAAAAKRQSGAPIALHVFKVLGEAIPASVRTTLDLPAFWLLLLPIELTAAFLPALFVLPAWFGRHGARSAVTVERSALATAAAIALAASWLLISTLADNNDLAWRAVLLASTILTIGAATGMAAWIGERRWLPVVLAGIAIALGLPETVLQTGRNLAGNATSDSRTFAQAPAVWDAVRRHSTIDERVANNPLALKSMTPWAVNLGWALLANRRSCYAGWELTQVYSSVPHDRLRAIDDQFVRVFAGRALPGDVEALAKNDDCTVVVVTPQDGAWTNDPFDASPWYRRVEDAAGWRIYRVASQNGTAAAK